MDYLSQICNFIVVLTEFGCCNVFLPPAVESVVLEDLMKYSSLVELWLFALHSSSNDFSQLSRVLSNSGGKLRRSGGYQGYTAVLLRVVRAALPLCEDEETRGLVSPSLFVCHPEIRMNSYIKIIQK